MKKQLFIPSPFGATLIGLLLLLVIGLLDYLTGAELGFFVFYYIPLIFVGWYVNARMAVFCSFFAAAVWLSADSLAGHVYTAWFVGLWNDAVRLTSFIIVSVAFSRLKRQFEKEQRLNAELTKALREVKKLSGLLPICASCKKIRDDRGYWNQIESYIRERSEAEFSHGICPDCARKLYPEFYTEDEADKTPDGERE